LSNGLIHGLLFLASPIAARGVGNAEPSIPPMAGTHGLVGSNTCPSRVEASFGQRIENLPERFTLVCTKQAAHVLHEDPLCACSSCHSDDISDQPPLIVDPRTLAGMRYRLAREPRCHNVDLGRVNDLGQVTQVRYPEPCIQHSRGMLVCLRHPYQVCVDACQLQSQFQASVPGTQRSNS
jgi:hypothetical protein